MVGDYDRAARWVDNTLGLTPGHVAAQILLSRLCILEDQTEKALAVLDNMLSISRSRLTQEQQEELADILEYYGREDPEHIEKDYPAISAFLKAELTGEGGGAPVQPAPPQPEAPASVMSDTAPAEQSGGSALAALQKLKSRLQSSLPEQAELPAQQTTPEQPVPEVSKPEQVQPTPAQSSAEVKAKLEEIAGKPVALAVKMRLYNTFAGAYFFKRDYASAQAFLEAAAGIDPQDAETLRNLAMLAHEQGQKEQALAYASKMPQTDFVLLAALR
jgi:tetratricopeptide (TPR) repeat protein